MSHALVASREAEVREIWFSDLSILICLMSGGMIFGVCKGDPDGGNA